LDDATSKQWVPIPDILSLTEGGLVFRWSKACTIVSMSRHGDKVHLYKKQMLKSC
jgi:hypothetical protein